MCRYTKYKVYLSEGQIEKIKMAAKKGEQVSLQIDQQRTPNYDLYLTKTQLGQLEKGKRITLSKTQLKKNGGLLPFLIPLITTLATGALSGAAGWGAKKILDKTTGSGLEDLIPRILSHPIFLDGLHQLLSGPPKKVAGRGILQNWEYPMRPSSRT